MPKLFDIREPNPEEGKLQPWQAWTVSVAAMPGEAPCSELQRLDLALRKRRGPRELDGLLERWRRAIEWPRLLYSAPEPPVWIRNLGERWRAVLRDAAGDPWHYPVAQEKRTPEWVYDSEQLRPTREMGETDDEFRERILRVGRSINDAVNEGVLREGISVKADPTMPLDEVELRIGGTRKRFKLGPVRFPKAGKEGR